MNKAIVLLTGSPAGKERFDNVARKTCWVWNTNTHDYQIRMGKELFWTGELSELETITNKHFNLDRKYVESVVERFSQNASRRFVFIAENGEQKTFENFLLVWHGLSRDLRSFLLDETDAISIHIAKTHSSQLACQHHFVLCENDEFFEEQVEKILSVLTRPLEITNNLFFTREKTNG